MNRNALFSGEEVDLSRFDDAFARASVAVPQDPSAGEVPDGFYETVVESVSIARTPRSGNPMISWQLRIQGPSYQGRRLVKNRVITDRTLSFLKEDLQRIGLEIARLSELHERLPEMRDREIRVLKRTKDGWVDVFFLRSSQDSAPQELDDALPF
jgi:hypothetical protein